MMRWFLLLFAVGVVVVVAVAGKRGDISRKPPLYVFPDMDRQLKLRPQTPNAFFANGLSSQLPPEGTIAQTGPRRVGGLEVYPFEDAPLNTGRVPGMTNFVELNPLPVTEALLARGRERYTIFCTTCHGGTGDGNGITKKIGAMAVVTSLHDRRLVETPDGDLYHTITQGKGLMGAYGPQIPVEDRWAIVAYVRALQWSRLGLEEDLTPELRAKLVK
jgi:mono/diheme cytochrome c family protein